MTVQMNAYLILTPGTARAAIERYAEVLGGTPQIMTFRDMGETGEIADHVMHGYLETADGHVLMVSDNGPGMSERSQDGNVALSLSGDDVTRLRGCWDALSDGGEIHVPLEKQMWGDHFGQLRDRFGVIWLVNIRGGE